MDRTCVTSDELEKIINARKSIVYLNDLRRDYDGYVIYVSQIDYLTYKDIMSSLNVDVVETSAKLFYIYIKVYYNSIHGRVDIYTDNNWKNFWNMKLDQETRDILMRRNNFV